MSEAKFTKGEWKVEGSSMSMGANYRGAFYVTSNCFDGDIFEAGKANARLISAAPEMYNLLERLTSHDNCKKDIIHLLGEADSLLAKARGEHE